MSKNGFTPDVSLDALFARNALSRPDAIALNCGDGTRYTFAQAYRASADIAAQIASMSLPAGSSIALLLPNGAEQILSLLGVLRAGHVPVAMPVAWRKSDLVRACRQAEAAALITTAHYGAENLPELAAEVAIEVFELSFPCAFGASLPDGIMPLSMSADGEAKPKAAAATDLVSRGIGTMQAENGGMSFVLHGDGEILAAGLGALLAADVRHGDRIFSAVSPSSFAGLATVFVPWLLSGGTLTPLAGFGPVEPVADMRAHLVATAGALWPVYHQLSLPLASATAIHFAGTHPHANYVSMSVKRIVDAYAMHELGVICAVRSDPAQPAPIPLGAVHAGAPSASAPAVIETNIDDHEHILIRGAMVPGDRKVAGHWLDTGITVDPSGEHGLHLQCPPDIIAVGSLRFSFPDLERRILAAALVHRVDAVVDRILGHRLIIETDRPRATTKALLEAGLPRVIANAVRNSEAQRARA